MSYRSISTQYGYLHSQGGSQWQVKLGPVTYASDRTTCIITLPTMWKQYNNAGFPQYHGRAAHGCGATQDLDRHRTRELNDRQLLPCAFKVFQNDILFFHSESVLAIKALCGKPRRQTPLRVLGLELKWTPIQIPLIGVRPALVPSLFLVSKDHFSASTPRPRQGTCVQSKPAIVLHSTLLIDTEKSSNTGRSMLK